MSIPNTFLLSLLKKPSIIEQSNDDYIELSIFQGYVGHRATIPQIEWLENANLKTSVLAYEHNNLINETKNSHSIATSFVLQVGQKVDNVYNTTNWPQRLQKEKSLRMYES